MLSRRFNLGVYRKQSLTQFSAFPSPLPGTTTLRHFRKRPNGNPTNLKSKNKQKAKKWEFIM